MALLDYTSPDQVRAILGVTDVELSDETMALEVYASGLSEDMLDIGETLETEYAVVGAVAPSARTTKQNRLWRTARLYATFSVARRVGTSLPMLAPKEITDGKSGVTRFALDPYKATLTAIENEFGLAKQRLTEAFASYSSTTAAFVTRTYAKVSSPSTDPVTGT